MRYVVAFCFALGLLLGAGTPAHAQVIHYQGPHPLPPRLGKGMCWIEGPHVHRYAPHQALLYVRVGPAYVFVGDPVEFEDDTPRYAYYGNHPVFWFRPGHGRVGHHYCYIHGPHFHWYAPPARVEAKYKRKGGVLWYVGPHPKWYRKHNWRARAWDHHYRRHKFHHPVVSVAPPSGWVGVVVSAPGVKVKVGIGGYIKAGLKIGGGRGHWHPGMGHWRHGMKRGHYHRGMRPGRWWHGGMGHGPKRKGMHR